VLTESLSFDSVRPPRRLGRLFAMVLVAAMLVGLFALPARADPLLTPEVREALRAQSMNMATSQQSALLFANNDAVNLARLNGGVSDIEYQAAQKDFARLNAGMARDAATDENARFDKQKSKSARYSPGTDSDYILGVESADQVKRIQKNYNQRVNAFLERNGVPGGREDWHRTLDVDFMADPRKVSQAEFEEIAKVNNAAYRRREAAEFEKISRANDGSRVTPAHYRAYAEEMRDFVQHKQELLDELRRDPEILKDERKAAEFHLLMAQEQKYVERVAVANQILRAQQGLPPSDSYEPRYTVETDADGNNVLRKAVRDPDGAVLGETLAELGAKRSPENFRVTAQADSVAKNSINRALTELAESMAEAGAKNWNYRRLAPEMMASLTQNMSAAEKGAILDRVKGKYGDAAAASLAAAMRGESSLFAATSLKDLDRRITAKFETDLSGATRVRQGFNEQASKALGALETVGRLKSYYDTAQLARSVIELMQKAVDPSLSAAERAKVQAELDTNFWSLMENHGFSMVLQQMPTVAAFYGTWSLAYDGTTLILQNTQTGQRLNAAAAAYADDNMRAADAFGADMREYLGLDTDRAHQEAVYQNLLLKILGQIPSRYRLREGMTAKDIGDALRDRDIVRLRNELIISTAQAPSPNLVAARKLRDAMAQAVRQGQAALPDLQRTCATGQALVAKLDGDLGTVEMALQRREAAGDPAARLAAALGDLEAAKANSDRATRTVTLARSVGDQHSDRACRAALTLTKGLAQADAPLLVDQAQSSARQTAASLRLARDELARMQAASEQAQAAVSTITRTGKIGGAEAIDLSQPPRLIDEAQALGDSLDRDRAATLAPSMEIAQRLFKEAGARIEAGASGEELAVLKQARAAYVGLADADEALARCRNAIAASTIAARARLAHQRARAGQLKAPALAAGETTQRQAVAADIAAAADAAELFVQAIDRADGDAQTCAEQARNAGRPATVTAWFNGLSLPAKQQFLERARRAGMTDDGAAYSVAQFASLTRFLDLQLDKLHLSPEARRNKIAELATGQVAGLVGSGR